MEKEEKRKEKEAQITKITEERIARNAERQRESELRKLQKLKERSSILDVGAIKETEFIIKELKEIIDNKGAMNVPCEDCQLCAEGGGVEGEICQCQCKNCEEVSPCLLFRFTSSSSFSGAIPSSCRE